MIHRRGTRIRAARAPRSTPSTERSQSFQTERLAEHSPGSCRPPPGAPGPIALCLPVRGLLCAGGVDVYGFCRRRTQPKSLPSSHGTRTYEIGVIHPHRQVVHIGLQISIQEGGVHSAPQHEGPTREQGEDTTAPAITIHIEYHAVLDCVVMRERIPVDS